MREVRRVACVTLHQGYRALQLKHQVFIVFMIDREEQARRPRPPGYLERLAAISLLTRPRCSRSFRLRRGGLVEANCLLRRDVGTSRSGDSGPLLCPSTCRLREDYVHLASIHCRERKPSYMSYYSTKMAGILLTFNVPTLCPNYSSEEPCS
ncbi:uncharacterized protein LACBIDRAFT_317482 [Laccaria bicolor S238N-H82]|uniref:Predicted protein n=1 Tax=Laccaria bicolor (strain S238N-H82 / ATCC MYA-4686) TaxID=486041 RepID=B0E1U8_LACBS|nr:uncharacterized protein LACBIDRAFT_317482 [Laccaria bicolor S238N-H82]EDQ99201.1 predicted protein [Laccaria bicolor S238N-H82]|eukprot:XP_001890168.1 predicted protein [Laccaria bicolor S238N-H82]